MSKTTEILRDWKFALGETRDCLEAGHVVKLPHTWNVESGSEEYAGTGWYACQVTIPKEWEKSRIIVRFEAVYHDAVIYLNGAEIGRHESSGYTPFEIELTQKKDNKEEAILNFGAVNELTVKASNVFTEALLPYKRSFDWPNDGGLIREVSLIVTGAHRLQAVRIDAQPILTQKGLRQDSGEGILQAEAEIDGETGIPLQLEWELYQGTENRTGIDRGCELCSAENICSVRRKLQRVEYWHFDRPQLYTLRLVLKKEGIVQDELEITFGFRDFHVEGSQFYLNGEAVRLCGTEWMPGSAPVYGMAEPKEQLEKMLRCLKESNCIFTRFHWQQDSFVYDWCDRHGMLIQEEVPFWGPDPAVAGSQQMEIAKQQLKEMIGAHRNHPSIIAWGVGNELRAQTDETIQYIQEAVKFTHTLDPSRTANYVSNSYFDDASKDGVVYGDVMLINDYIGTWSGELDEHEELQKVLKANPNKPLVPSEFGLCEPAFSGGDERREAIFLEKMEAYRQYDAIAGTIYFCLNDYRTQVGEDGEGKLRRRIHGSTLLNGEIKPSYLTVQRECAPFELQWKGTTLQVNCRKNLPCYTMKGYKIEFLDETGTPVKILTIPDLLPGDHWEIDGAESVNIRIFRANGDFAGLYPCPK